ncbi:hypothetical protein, partial [Thiolapillus sp.]|uniref:hypothetical protein n=1 Tax=Thiolapillus sp. TaxID=2017437 RepID=UPI003AF94957
LSAYCRERGLYVEQINEWRQACEQANDWDRSQNKQLKSIRCRVPCDYIPKRSYLLFRTRQILNDWLTQNLEEA